MADNEQPDILSVYADRFTELGDEAKANGVRVVTILQRVDPFEDTTAEMFTYNTGPVVGMGLALWVIDRMREKAV